jgi:MFS family permease
MVLSAPMAGWIVRKCEKRQLPFLGGLSCAFGATLFFMIGTRPWIIIVARTFQGLSASVVYTAGLTLLVDTIESHELGPWIGFGLSGMNFGVLVSPTLGGIVYEKAGFYYVFVMALGIILINLVLILLIIDRKAAERYRAEFDPDGVSAVRNGNHANKSTTHGKRRLSRVENGDLNVTTPLLSRRREPTAEVTIHATWSSIVGGFVRNPRIVAALYGCLINTILMSSMDAVLPIFVKQTFHWLSGATGAIFLNLTIPSLIGPFIGMVSDKYGVRLISVLGFTSAAIGAMFLALIQNDDITSKVLACIFLFVVGKSDLLYVQLKMRYTIVNMIDRCGPQYLVDSSRHGDTSDCQSSPRRAA